MKIYDSVLKPCPFCGNKKSVHAYTYKDAVYRQYAVKCNKCGARIMGASTELAIDKWNRRAERKKGEWNNYKDEHGCSVCQSVVIQEDWDDDIRYDYCPYCGADMRGE